MSLLTKCEICNGKRFWFFIKQRSMKPNEFMPVIKSQKKMCGKCFKSALTYNFKADNK